MAQTFHVYPKATLNGSTWLFDVSVNSPDANVEFNHVEVAGVTAYTPLILLKIGFDLTVADTDTEQDIDDALYLDDIQPGPQVQTVWGNWRDLAETIITGMTEPYTDLDFRAEWRPQDTNAVRQDANQALVNQRGWSITNLHWHEGDQTVHDQFLTEPLNPGGT